jgi:hypothetical protein
MLFLFIDQLIRREQMDEIKDQKIPNPEGEKEEEEDLEQNHTDKLVGLFTEPVETFRTLAKFPPKTIDWLIPLLVLSIVSVISFGIQMSDSQVEYEFIEKQMPKVEEQLQSAIDSGAITEEQADTQRGFARKTIVISTYAAKFFIPWFMTLISALVYMLLARYVNKGSGTYVSSLVSLSLPGYILMLSAIATAILTLATGVFYQSINLSELLSMDLDSTAGKLLMLVDVFMIWYFIIVSIAYAKIFGGKGIASYVIMVFGFWLVISIPMLLLM